MAITKPRTRLVNFRVSEDEFKSLREACETGGARSISDFARHAVLGAPEKGANESKEVLGLRLALIEEKMGEVDAKLFQIARLLGDSNVVPMTRTAAFQFS
ncbi:MAG: hypothetical protein FJW32_20585 [Acidobacteria bacterium]|nr:hypothetical protein [Acidobacteriota bacterium]